MGRVVAMSGGVDSSVAAALLVEQGHDVIGVHMKLHDAPTAIKNSSKTCCGIGDALDARLVCEKLNVPFYVMDLREAFQKAAPPARAFNATGCSWPAPRPLEPRTLPQGTMPASARPAGSEWLWTGLRTSPTSCSP